MRLINLIERYNNGLERQVLLKNLWGGIFLLLFIGDAFGIESYLPKEQSSVIVHSEYLVDEDNALNIDNIRHKSTEADWQALKEDYANFGYQPSPYWYRFTISNPDVDPIKQIIEVSYPLLDTLDYYEYLGDQVIKVVHTGDRVPYSERLIEHPHFLFPIELSANEKHTIYLKVMTKGSQLVPIKLWEGTKLFVELAKKDSLHALYLGFVAVIIFFNLLIFIALREKMYLYYAATAFLFSLFFSVMQAKLYPYIFSNSPEFHHTLLLILPSSCLLFSALFSREFLHPEQYSKNLNRVIDVLIAIACLGLLGVFIFDSQTSLKLSVLSAIPGCFMLFLLGPILGFMGNRMAWVYTAAWSTFMFGATITALSKQGFMPVSFATEYSMQIGSAIELFTLNAALAFRFYREHKARLLAQENRLLENSERREIELELLNRSMSDAITQLPNRLCFEQQVQKTLEVKGKTRIAVCVIEVLRYQEISRTLGAHNTDLMMTEVALHFNKIMSNLPGVKEIQAPSSQAHLCSLEHGVFGMLVDADFAEQNMESTNNVIRQLIKPFEFNDMRLELRPVMGVAVCPEHGLDAAVLLRHAQVAAGSTEAFERHVSYYKPEYDQYNARRLMMVSELKDAIKNGHLELFFQPKYSLKEHLVIGVEALVRWHHERYGVIRPDEFIEIAEQTGVIKQLTRWVVQRALLAQLAFKKAGYDVNMSINLSTLNLREGDLLEFLQEQLQNNDVDPANIYIELTETSMMEHPLDAIDVLEKISQLGINISVDDFGAGYSSLAYLKSLPASEIKIDKSLISSICSHDSSDMIAKATIDMCQKLGFSVVAEGVESQAVMDRLEALDCDIIQGYLLTPPLPYAKLVQWLEVNSATRRFVS